MTGSGTRVRGLLETDLEAVGALVARSFDPGLRPFMVATQHGWTEHLRVKLAHPDFYPGSHLAVVEDGGQLLAFSDYRTRDSDGFLSYICVDEGARGRGLATHLFGWLVQHGRAVDRVSLDVFDDNELALKMYASLGFRAVTSLTWWAAPIERVPHHGRDTALRVEIPDLHESLAALELFGFCQIRAKVDGEDVTCGRLGSKVLRLTALDDPREHELFRAMADAFPELELAFVVTSNDVSGQLPAATRVATAVRMVCDEPTVIASQGRAPA